MSSASGTSIQTDAPSMLIAARFSGSANVPPPVATTTWRMRPQQREHFPLNRAEVRLALLREDLRDRALLAHLDQVVDVFEPPAQVARPDGGPRCSCPWP